MFHFVVTRWLDEKYLISDKGDRICQVPIKQGQVVEIKKSLFNVTECAFVVFDECFTLLSPGGPTSFSPIIAKAIEIVKQTRKYHILVVIADGQVTEETPTIDAIVEASKHPISIIVVGIGDGPWDIMEEFDHRLPKRRFDNFRFVNYHKATLKAKNPDTAFALQTLMEIPDQYKRIKKLGYLGDVSEGPEGRGDTASGGGSTPPHCSPRGSPKRGVSGRGSPSPHSSISGRGSPAAGTPHSSPTGSPRHQPYVNGHSTTSPRHRVIPDRITTSV